MYRLRVLVFLGLGGAVLAQEKLPEGKGRETLENTCTECHGLDKVLSEVRTSAGWREIARRMRSKGATMTDAELDTLVEYLFQNFGKDDASAKAAGKIEVNKATARELEEALELNAAAAAAIVRYREAHGAFKEWQELAKVDGVESAKIEAKKDRLIF